MKHGQAGTRLYRIYRGMIQRCTNPHTPSYVRYGAKGITMCEEWLNSFQLFAQWAHSHGYADNLTIDRIDPDQGYSPKNCRWLTKSENSQRVRYTRGRSTKAHLKLTKLRDQADLSQADLATLTGIDVRVIQNYEQGVRNLNGAKLLTLLQFCKALQCDLQDIISDPEALALLDELYPRT